MQADVKSLMAAELLPLLLRAAPADAPAVELLRHWDATMLADRAEPLIFIAWIRELTRLIYADELGDLFEVAWSERPIFLGNVLADKDGQGRWCDDVARKQKQSCDQLIAKALDLALADLTQRFGSDMSRWRWGETHIARSVHRPFSRLPVLGWLFDITVPVPGDTYTLDVGRPTIDDDHDPFAVRLAPSLRAIYDLADLDRSVFIHSTGQSGNRLSPHYADFTERWAHVEYLSMSTKRADIATGMLGTLVLQPAP